MRLNRTVEPGRRFFEMIFKVRKVGSPHVHFIWKDEERTLCDVHTKGEVELAPRGSIVDCKVCKDIRRMEHERLFGTKRETPSAVLAAHYRQQDADLADEETRREQDDGLSLITVHHMNGETTLVASDPLLTPIPYAPETVKKVMHMANRAITAEEHAVNLARVLADEDDFSQRTVSYGKAVQRCRHCEAIKDEQAIIQWTHGDGCPVNLALQVIENYTNKEKDE